MSINRNLSLDELTNDLADRTGNFSQWVRCKLLEEFSKELDHTFAEDNRNWLGTGKCNPGFSKGCCYLCWPEGVPSKDKLRDYFLENMERNKNANA